MLPANGYLDASWAITSPMAPTLTATSGQPQNSNPPTPDMANPYREKSPANTPTPAAGRRVRLGTAELVRPERRRARRRELRGRAVRPDLVRQGRRARPRRGGGPAVPLLQRRRDPAGPDRLHGGPQRPRRLRGRRDGNPYPVE